MMKILKSKNTLEKIKSFCLEEKQRISQSFSITTHGKMRLEERKKIINEILEIMEK